MMPMIFAIETGLRELRVEGLVRVIGQGAQDYRADRAKTLHRLAQCMARRLQPDKWHDERRFPLNCRAFEIDRPGPQPQAARPLREIPTCPPSPHCPW
ncbi:hypothetical protein FQZ97_1029130 [compost metagenome]